MKKILNIVLLVAMISAISCSKDNIDSYGSSDVENPKKEDTPLLINGHEYVDLGLSVKWATCNVGANSPEEYGGYYCWGETREKYMYTEDTYEYYKNGKYQNIGVDICGTDYDVATIKWGGSWRLPTKNEVYELLMKCKYRLSVRNMVYGYEFTGTNGKTIFIPLAGDKYVDRATNQGRTGAYLIGEKDPIKYYTFTFDLN